MSFGFFSGIGPLAFQPILGNCEHIPTSVSPVDGPLLLAPEGLAAVCMTTSETYLTGAVPHPGWFCQRPDDQGSDCAAIELSGVRALR